MLIGLPPLYAYTETAVGERVVHWNQKENTVKWKYSQEDLSDPAGMWAINYKRTFDLFENNMETIQTFKYKNTYRVALSFQIEITLKRVLYTRHMYKTSIRSGRSKETLLAG